MDGVLNINKPSGMTSHDVVARLRWILSEKKVGHTGTLDPDATGVLPVCLGRATKIIRFLQEEEKCYEGTITLGIATDTQDSSGKAIEISDSANVEPDAVKQIFDNFLGEMDQIPPMVSAIKVQGKRLYSIAREGKTIDRAPRKINIYDLVLLGLYKEKTKFDSSRLFTRIDFRVRCSRGTYVRTLASDIGNTLGYGGHLSRLIRTKSGFFKIEDSIGLEEIQADPLKVNTKLLSIENVLSFMPRIIISDADRKKFMNGVPVEESKIMHHDSKINDLIRVYDEANLLLGIGEIKTLDSQTKICKVLSLLK